MKALKLDWLSRPQRSGIGWVLLALGVAGAVLSAERHHSWSIAAGQLEAASVELRQTTRRSAARVREPARDQSVLQQEVRAANLVVEQLNIPWPELFRDLEVATDPTVSLMAIQPDTAARSVRLEGEARDYGSVLAFVGRLEDTRAFSIVHVASHQVRVEAPARPVGFALLAGWRADPR